MLELSSHTLYLLQTLVLILLALEQGIEIRYFVKDYKNSKFNQLTSFVQSNYSGSNTVYL